MNTALFNPIGIASILFIALAYNAWGFLGKYLGVSGAWLSFVVFAGTFLGATLPGMLALSRSPMPSIRSLVFMLVAGGANGAAVYLAANKMVDPSVPSAVFFMTLLIITIAIAPFMSWVMHGDVLNAKQWAGVALAIFAIYLLQA